MFLTYVVNNNNSTINQILKNELHISSRLLFKLINKKLITCNNKLIDTRLIPQNGDFISIDLNYMEDNSNIIPTEMDLDIIYEDDCLIVINKPSGIAVHPSVLHFDNTLSNGLKFYFDKIHLYKKIRPVNRLDKNTSGLIIFAKNEYIQEILIQQMENKTFVKEYLAVICGILTNKKGTINKPIARKKDSIIERCISPDGKPSITHYKVIKESSSLSLVKCKLETGRTHQIRVHFASIGHPLLGDELYGDKSSLSDGQALLCYKLSFIHPITKKNICFQLDDTYFCQNLFI